MVRAARVEELSNVECNGLLVGLAHGESLHLILVLLHTAAGVARSPRGVAIGRKGVRGCVVTFVRLCARVLGWDGEAITIKLV